MFKVTSNEYFREGYELLAILTDDAFARDCDKSKVEEYIIEIKRELRKWAHKPETEDVGMGFEITRKVFGGDYDGFYELVSIPNVFKTESDADEFFNDFIRRDYVPSPYDCTGQLFTSWYHLFKRNNQFFAYHRVCADV